MNKKILENYENAVNDIMKHFCKKQGLDFEYWIGNHVGEIACFKDDFLNLDVFFSFDDIVHDLRNDAPKYLISEWYYGQLNSENQRINYRSYIMGARFKLLKKNKTDFYKKLGNMHGITGLEIKRSCYSPKDHLYVEVSKMRCTSNEVEEVQKMLNEQNWFEWTFTLVP